MVTKGSSPLLPYRIDRHGLFGAGFRLGDAPGDPFRDLRDDAVAERGQSSIVQPR